MAEHSLALAINGREYQLNDKLVAYTAAEHPPGDETLPVAVVGLGYVGLPTALALHNSSLPVTGLDISEDRLNAIRRGDVGLHDSDHERLRDALNDSSFRLTSDDSALTEADAVIICVPTPVDEDRAPDVAALTGACKTVVSQARQGQTIILTSTSFVGTTRQFLVEPLQRRGFTVGTDIFVAFSPERIDPGNPDHLHRTTPRVVGGVTPQCQQKAAQVLGYTTDSIYLVSAPEAAEMTKLYENIFRAVTLALANEMADICGTLNLDPIEVTLAAGTKPYGFLAGFPGPGVGGHCIPCDPHYLLWQLRNTENQAPIIEQTMRSIAARPARVVERAAELLGDAGISASGARILLVGVSYKAGVPDLRESPALSIVEQLLDAGADVQYYDPLVPQLDSRLSSVDDPANQQWDLVIIHTVHPGLDYQWATRCPRVLDATYQFDAAAGRQVV